MEAGIVIALLQREKKRGVPMATWSTRETQQGPKRIEVKQNNGKCGKRKKAETKHLKH